MKRHLLSLALLACTASGTPNYLSQGEHPLPGVQGTCVNPKGEKLEVTTKCLRLNGRAILPQMGEMHYSRVPSQAWAESLRLMRDGGISIVSTYVFWNHHEFERGKYDFGGNRDLNAFLSEVEKAGLWAVVRIGPWAHGEAREGGLPDWMLKDRSSLRTANVRFLSEVERFWRRLFFEVESHLWKHGGCVVGVQLENESRGPWNYYQALKELAVGIGYDVPFYTRTGWQNLKGPPEVFGEMIPVYGDYAEGFWDRVLTSMPEEYRNSFKMKSVRTSSAIATEHFGLCKAIDAQEAARYPYFTCEVGGGMTSSYHRRLNMEPMDAFALAVVKLGSGVNLIGYYMYRGGTNPSDTGLNMAESQRGRYTNYNDLPPVSYEFQGPLSQFGEKQCAYWHVRALGEFCRRYGEELATEDPVFVSENESRRGRFVFHNEYIRRVNPDGCCWIGIERDGKIERIVDGKVLSEQARASFVPPRMVTLKLLKHARTAPRVTIGPGGVAMMPDESAWSAAAEYEVNVARVAGNANDCVIAVPYDGDMARLYADGKLVQDDFWRGVPLRYDLNLLPKGNARLTLKVLPWGEGVRESVFVDYN